MTVIVHLVERDELDKFPVGYINFMKLRMTGYEHHFFLSNSDSTHTINAPLDLCDNQNVYYYDDMLAALTKPESLKLLSNCDKIIANQPFSMNNKIMLFLIRSGLSAKTYLYFWNSHDFQVKGFTYMLKRFLRKLIHPRATLHHMCMHLLVKKSAGIMGLMDADVKALLQTFPEAAKSFVATMPGNPLIKYDFSARDRREKKGTYRILVGHSAHHCSHLEGFQLLEHLKGENIEIVCPLSYGVPEVRENVMTIGRRMFGDKFVPVTGFMTRQEYIDFLGSCDVGVYPTHVQHGMGNISLMLKLGKKVYMRDDTTMWQQYRRSLKYTVYPVSELEGITLEQLVNFPQEVAYNNIRISEEYAAQNDIPEQWQKVFED